MNRTSRMNANGKRRRNVRLVIAYDGSAYHGWQRQAEDLPTIQQHVETAARDVLGHPVIVFGASRTDAGVHAEGQATNLYTPNLSIPLRGLRRAMNAKLPRDIAVVSAVEAPDDFHAARSALGKTYRYRIYVSPARPAGLSGRVYHYWRALQIESMRRAARKLVGTHDFRGFASSAEDRQSTVRTIHRCEVAETAPEVLITVRGDGFLYNMVRNIVGTLVEIGRGRWDPPRVDTVLATRDRRHAGPTAPPEGLTLVCVHY